MKRRLVFFIVISVVVVALVGCTSKTAKNNNNKAKEKKKPVHISSAKALRQKSKAAEQLISQLEQVRDDTRSISKIATGRALKQMVAQVESDLKEGKIKARKLTEPKLKLMNVTKGLIGVKLTYTDMSYYLSKSTSKPLTKPTGDKKEVVLALRQVKGKWKIAEIAQIGAKKTR